jgi:hypothetical protein
MKYCIGKKDEFNACAQGAMYCYDHAARLGNAELREQIVALKLAQAQEKDEFNAGYQAFVRGLDPDAAELDYNATTPAPSYDVFRIGYVWAKYISSLSIFEKAEA